MKKFRPHPKWAWLLLIFFILIIAFFTYHGYSQYADKKKFEQARADIDTIYADIVAKIGPPDNSKKVNDCSRPNQVFEQGPLSCSVGTSFIYGVADENGANEILKMIEIIVGEKPKVFKPVKSLANKLSDTLVVNSYYHIASDKYTDSGLDCVLSYVFDTPREIDLALKDDARKPLQINVDCTGRAKKEYFPLHIYN